MATPHDHLVKSYDEEMSRLTGEIAGMGELVEFDDTERIFTKPARQQTEDYISGRFG